MSKHPPGRSLFACIPTFQNSFWRFAFRYSVTPVPMVGMFDAAIRAANASGDYDEARTCAVQKLEQAKSLPYEAVEGGLQNGVCEPSGFAYEMAARPVGTDLGDGSG